VVVGDHYGVEAGVVEREGSEMDNRPLAKEKSVDQALAKSRVWVADGETALNWREGKF
jgi:hypothetical protein